MDKLKELKDLLPYPLRSLMNDNPPEEIRLYRQRQVITLNNGKKALTPLVCTNELFDETLSMLTHRSFYAYSDCLKEGYLPLPCGARAAVAGQAVCENKRIETVKEISFLSLRIPKPIYGAAEPLLQVLRRTAFKKSALIYSPPGVGKTTVLRELARALSSPPYLLFVALADERGELSFDLDACPSLTVYLYYPKAQAMEYALRTAGAEVIITDEIGYEERDGLRACGKGGVTVIASAHAGSLEELKREERTAQLLESGFFEIYAGLTRKNGKLSFEITIPGETK